MKCGIIALSLSLASSAFAGTREREGGGGNIIAAKFVSAGRQAIEILGHGDFSLDINRINEDIRDVKVIPVGEICHQHPTLELEYCEDAHFDAASNTILLDFQKWDRMTCADKLTLSVHEFLRAAGLEGEDYKYSGRFLSRTIARCDEPSDEFECADLNMSINREVETLCEKLCI